MTLADMIDHAVNGNQRRITERLAWVTLDDGNAGITRAAVDADGDLALQNLHVEKSVSIWLRHEALPMLRTLLGMPEAAPAPAPAPLQEAAQRLAQAVELVLTRCTVHAAFSPLLAEEVAALHDGLKRVQAALQCRQETRP